MGLVRGGIGVPATVIGQLLVPHGDGEGPEGAGHQECPDGAERRGDDGEEEEHIG